MFDFLREACDRNCDQSALRTTNLIDYDDVFKVDNGDNVVVVDAEVVGRPVGQVYGQSVHVLAEVWRYLKFKPS